MDITKEQLRNVFVQSGGLFGVEVKQIDIPQDLVDKMLPLAKDFFLEESTSMAIKFHLRIEHLLDFFLRKKAPKPEFLDKIARNYESKVSLALLLGLPKERENGLRVVGRIRNKSAHDADFAFDQRLMDALHSSFSSEEKEYIDFLFDKIRLIETSIKDKQCFQDLEVVDQFKLLIMFLWMALYVIIEPDQTTP